MVLRLWCSVGHHLRSVFHPKDPFFIRKSFAKMLWEMKVLTNFLNIFTQRPSVANHFPVEFDGDIPILLSDVL